MAGAQDAQPKKKGAKKKDTFTIPEWDWSKTVDENMEDIADMFTLGRTATTLTDKVLASWKDFHLLPEDHQINSKTYYRYVFVERSNLWVLDRSFPYM